MNKVTLISVDLAKDVFQVAGCVRLLPAQHVKPFVRGNKSDHNDAVAIAEASRRPKINEVPIKTVAQQEIQSLHRMRDLCVQRRTAVMNQAIVLSASIKIQYRLIAEEYHQLTARITGINEQLRQIVVEQPECQLLSSIPGIGVINATAIYSAIGGGNQFKNAREFAVWLGLTPRQSSSGNSFSSGGITKRGDRYLRKQLVHGARALLCSCRNKTDRLSMWANALVARRGYNKACVGLAARLARLCWILLQKKEVYEAK